MPRFRTKIVLKNDKFRKLSRFIFIAFFITFKFTFFLIFSAGIKIEHYKVLTLIVARIII